MEKERLWNPQYVALMTANIFASCGFYMVNTMLISYLTGNEVGLSSEAAGIIAGMFSITALISRPFCGIMADRFNKVWLLRAATLFMVAGAFGYGLSKALPFIVFARILHGIGFAINSTTLISLVTQYVPQNKLGEGLGYFGLANVIASATAPGFGVMVAGLMGTGKVFWIAGIMCVGEILLLIVVKYPGAKRTTVQKAASIGIKDIIAVEVLGYTCVSSMFSFSNGIVTSYLVLYGRELGIGNISLYFTINALAMFLVRPVSGKLMDKKGMYIVAFPGMALTIVSMLLLASAGRFTGGAFAAVMVSSVLKALGQGAAQPSLQAACIKKVGKERSGSATSTYYLGGDIGQGLAPMIAGVIVGSALTPLKGYIVSFNMTAVLLALAMIGLVFIYRKEKMAKRFSEASKDAA
ncbi:MFS transporter [Parablautia intestinalis]|uniref:MFS transporter n=1 Tax=Parablautia intestinalis TaxID=2320100 RepID=UPI00259C71F9|nr:MFS transporter [Parablautia intestinalis]